MSFDVMLRQAQDCYMNGAYQEAERLCRSLLAFVPENSDVLNILGLVAAANGDHATAALYFEDALKKAQNKLPIYFNLAASLAEDLKIDEAIRAYQTVLKLAPNTKEALNNLGALYEKKGDVLQALNCYQKAISIDENYVEALVNAAVLNKDMAALKTLAERFEKSALPCYHLAAFAFENKQFQSALSHALRADGLETAYDIKCLIARIYDALKDENNVVKYYHQALLLNPKSVEVLICLGTKEQNEDYFKKALSIHPQDYQAHLKYADFLYANSRTIEAVEEYHKAVLINENDAALSNNVGLILKDLGDEKRALDLMLNAFLKAPENVDISINIAETLVLLYQKEPDEALRIARLWAFNAKNNVFAARILAAFEQKPSADDYAYAKALFDEFADVYENRMHNIRYAVFDKIKEAGVMLNGHVLDLGCGTGLAATHFKTQNTSWTGVDISEKMLEKAAEKKLYDHLVQSDIVDYLQKNNQKFDDIICLDVVEYLENVEELIKLCYPARLILSFEKAEDAVKTYKMSPMGRYQHNPDFISKLFSQAGYQKIDKYALILRQENGVDVKGFLFVGQTS